MTTTFVILLNSLGCATVLYQSTDWWTVIVGLLLSNITAVVYGSSLPK